MCNKKELSFSIFMIYSLAEKTKGTEFLAFLLSQMD